MAIFGRKKKAEAEKAAAGAAVAAETDEKNGRDSPESASTQGPKGNPFATPRFSEPPSRDPQESEGSGYFPPVQTTSYVPRRRKFVSARLKEGEFDEKPWVRGKDDPNYKRRRWEKAMFWICIGVGILIGAAICAFEYINVSTGDFCQIWQDDFKDIDSSSWSYELQRGGFGTGSFEWAVNDPKNAYVDAAGLHIVPTITVDSTDITPDQLMDGYVINNTLTDCTSKDYTMCSIRSNKTSGDIINPVRSARLVTRGKRSIKYGRVEVVAKMPRGDWLWPAIWMMPEGSDGSGQYGAWPQSGEIDIAESRGNSPENYTDGRNSIISALHWGPTPMTDAFWRTSGKHNVKRTDYAAAFHTYGLEWTKDYLFTYIDSKLLQVFFLKFSQGPSTMWQRGDFGTMLANKSALNNPWLTSVSQQNAPFDQPFYLILNVAVGSTNGFFPDQKSNKPWGDGSLTAPAQFYAARNSWEPTWGAGDARGMTVKSVKMWKEGKCT